MNKIFFALLLMLGLGSALLNSSAIAADEVRVQSVSLDSMYVNVMMVGEMNQIPEMCRIVHWSQILSSHIVVTTDPESPESICFGIDAPDYVELKIPINKIPYGEYDLVVDGWRLGVLSYVADEVEFRRN